MNVPIQTEPALWGAACGAAALAIVGFSWGGWITGGKAEAASLMRVNAAVVTAMAPVCADKFKRAADFAANLSALQKVDTWSRGEFVEKGGWASMTASDTPPDRVSAVASACAALLVPS